MAIVAAAVIGFIHSGGSGDYGGLLLSALWLRSGYTNKQRKGTSPTTPFFLLGLLLSPPVTISPGLKTLKRLSLAFNRITDACLVHLKGASNFSAFCYGDCLFHMLLLSLVNLDSCKIGDEGLANLTGLTLLRSLVLSDTEIGSSGLRHISDEYENSTRLHLLVKDVHNLPEGLRIVVNFDRQHAAIGEATGLLAGVCGQLATDCNLCKRNQEIRQKQIISHTSGAKSIARRRAELMEETGKEVSRVQMWDITHRKIDGSYVNEKAKEIAEKIEAYSSQQAVESTVNSPLDALGVVLGKEHPGRVRGLGMGAVPTVAFKNNTTRISQMNLGSSNDAGTSSTCSPNVQEELDTVKAQLQALVSYITSKEGGKIPVELAGMFPTRQISQGLDQESEIPSPRELGSRSSGASNKEA
nr:uncharacterized protein LOC112786309 [Arachis hypogaea]